MSAASNSLIRVFNCCVSELEVGSMVPLRVACEVSNVDFIRDLLYNSRDCIKRTVWTQVGTSRFWKFSQGTDSLTAQRSFSLRHSLQEDGSGAVGLVDEWGGEVSLEPKESCCGDSSMSELFKWIPEGTIVSKRQLNKALYFAFATHTYVRWTQ